MTQPLHRPSRLPMPHAPICWQRLRAAWRAGHAAWRATATPERGGDARQLATLLEHSPDLVLQLDPDDRLAGCNALARSRLAGEALALSQLVEGSDWARWQDEARPALRTRGVWVGELTLRLDGAPQRFGCTALPARDGHGRNGACTLVLRDLAATQAAQQIQRQNQILSAITEALPATVVIVDVQGRYRYVNSAFERYAARPAAEILGRTAVEVLGSDEIERRRPFMKRAFAGEAVDFVLDYPGEAGTTWLALSCIPIKLDGVFDGFVGISQDISHQRREQERLADLAEHDPLTGLLNRAGFEQRLTRQRAVGDSDELALLYIDLDHFKAINDTLGHGAGDQLLRDFAQRLRHAVRATDVVARLGGDEFAVLLTGVCDLATARLVGDKVLRAASQPFELDGREGSIGASIGLAVLPRAQATLAELLHQADQQLYRAKAAGRGRQCSPDGDPAAAI